MTRQQIKAMALAVKNEFIDALEIKNEKWKKRRRN